MAARGLVNGRGPRSGRDLVFRCYPPELLFTPPQKKTEADLLGQPLSLYNIKSILLEYSIKDMCKAVACIQKLFLEKRGEVIYELI